MKSSITLLFSQSLSSPYIPTGSRATYLENEMRQKKLQKGDKLFLRDYDNHMADYEDCCVGYDCSDCEWDSYPFIFVERDPYIPTGSRATYLENEMRQKKLQKGDKLFLRDYDNHMADYEDCCVGNDCSDCEWDSYPFIFVERARRQEGSG